ncbi:roadblock/LC7 domain-containing protein [candidate division KSB1 bacterium]|nr:roadblock/LC7 domain-containing protein [candidate division KSB1 bacterium]
MNVEKGGNGQPVVLSGEMYKAISEVLSDLAAKTRAKTIIFADSNGHPITQRGQTSEINIPNMAALGAGDFAATSEMAKIVGEPGRFKYLYHEGEKSNVYLSSVTDNFLLLIVFDTNIALGMIRIFTKRTIEKLTELLNEAKGEEQKASEFLDVEFSTYLNKELDKAFNF